jgi:hypothetical protein
MRNETIETAGSSDDKDEKKHDNGVKNKYGNDGYDGKGKAKGENNKNERKKWYTVPLS